MACMNTATAWVGCNVGETISITSNSGMRYVGIVDSVDPQQGVICLKSVRSFGTEGRRKDGAQVLPDDRVFDNVQFRRCDIKDLQVLSIPSSVQVLAVPDDPAIIQCRPLHPAPTLASSAQDTIGSCEADLNLNAGIGLNIKESLPLVTPTQDLTSFCALNLAPKHASNLHNMISKRQEVKGILGGVPCVGQTYSLGRPFTLAEYDSKQHLRSSDADMPLNCASNSLVSFASSSQSLETDSVYLSPTSISSPFTLNAGNLSPNVVPKHESSVPYQFFQGPRFSFQPSETILGKDVHPVSLWTIDRSNPLLRSCLPHESVFRPMAPENQISDINHPHQLKPYQDIRGQVLQTGSHALSSFSDKDSALEDAELVKPLVLESRSADSSDFSVPTPQLAAHAKTLSLALPFKSEISQAPTVSLPIPSTEKADSRSIQLRQPRKSSSFGRSKKVYHLATNHTEEFDLGSVNAKSNKTGVRDNFSKIQDAQLKAKSNTHDVNIHHSEKVADTVLAYAKNESSNSTIPPESESVQRNRNIAKQQKMDTETFGHSLNNGKSHSNPLSGRSANFRGSTVGRGHGDARRSQAESIGKHVT